MLWNLSDAFDHQGYSSDRSLESLSPIEIGGVTYPVEDLAAADFHLTHKDQYSAEVSGHVSLTLVLSCDRCLEDVRHPFDLSFSYQLVSPSYPGDDKEEYEYDFMNGYELDPELLIRDEILMDWPMKVLCSDSCKGICMKCGTNLNKGSCSCDTFVPDPRWAGLKEIFDAGNKEV